MALAPCKWGRRALWLCLVLSAPAHAFIGPSTRLSGRVAGATGGAVSTGLVVRASEGMGGPEVSTRWGTAAVVIHRGPSFQKEASCPALQCLRPLSNHCALQGKATDEYMASLKRAEGPRQPLSPAEAERLHQEAMIRMVGAEPRRFLPQYLLSHSRSTFS
jgi:hypothetical protein